LSHHYILKMQNKSLLILEDDKGLREVLAADFEDKGFDVFQAEQLRDVANKKFDFAIIDLRLNGESGLQIIESLLELNPHCRIVVLTGFGSIATAVEAMKLGAINYLTKPANSEQIEEAFEASEINKESVASKAKRISLSQNEHEYINFVLTQNSGNISKTARELGLHRQSLQRKLKKNP
jgi:two-component system response regulator RegA